MGGTKTKRLSAGLRAALRTAGQPGILHYALTVCLAFTGREAGNIAFRTREGLTVFLFLVVGNESHIKQFFIR